MNLGNDTLNNQQTEVFQKLHQVLFQEKTTFEQLSELLTTERQALEQQNIDDVVKLTAKKQQITQNLEKLSEVRMLLLDHLGLTLPNKQQIKNSHPQLPANSLSLWNEILQCVELCHDKNSINGKIIQASHSSVSRSLQLLKSQSGDLGLTYTAKGQTNSRLSSAGTLKA
ncbi:MAG TPA: flagellar protein FlgN [Aeromonadales bacterium]|nr:flagellar protein FlgN [Aeromonadales bacterium]